MRRLAVYVVRCAPLLCVAVWLITLACCGLVLWPNPQPLQVNLSISQFVVDGHASTTNRRIAESLRMGRSTTGSSARALTSEAKPLTTINLVYFAENSDILDEKMLKRIQGIEKELFTQSWFQEICYKNSDSIAAEAERGTQCTLPESFINFAFPSREGVFDGYGPLTDDLPGTLRTMFWNDLVAYFDRNFNDRNLKSQSLMSVIYIGHPFEGTAGSREDMKDKLGSYSSQFLNFADANSDSSLRIVVRGTSAMYIQELYDALEYSAYMVGGAVIVVVVLMLVFKRSVYAVSVGLMQIVVTLPLTYLLFTTFIEQELSFMKLLSVFVIIGVSVDDQFIFYDALRQEWQRAIDAKFSSQLHVPSGLMSGLLTDSNADADATNHSTIHEQSSDGLSMPATAAYDGNQAGHQQWNTLGAVLPPSSTATDSLEVSNAVNGTSTGTTTAMTAGDRVNASVSPGARTRTAGSSVAPPGGRASAATQQQQYQVQLVSPTQPRPRMALATWKRLQSTRTLLTVEERTAACCSAWTHSGLSMLVTSSTTMVSFGLTAALTAIPSIRQFGWWMTLLIGLNYVLAMTIYAIAILVGFQCAQRSCSWYTRPSKHVLPPVATDTETGQAGDASDDKPHACSRVGCCQRYASGTSP